MNQTTRGQLFWRLADGPRWRRVRHRHATTGISPQGCSDALGIDEATRATASEHTGAVSIYDKLTGPGASLGVAVAIGKNVLRIEYQATERVLNPSPHFNAIVKVAKKVVAKLRRS